MLVYSIPIANYSAEREFSKLARLKNKYRTNILCTESNVLEVINTQNIIRVCFPKIKKKLFIQITFLFLKK
ncbi:zinc finger MYM-type protein 1-like [Aphis craccivora]|uniref:Zinc finger MYM-type protein 1-like n=1 Tax=Aphis craccivora TaxID=307492 RepID=A0A6G0VVS7_APHCR|nr:zinc finger MYM-type protein 1-like [Aphis craccivora]